MCNISYHLPGAEVSTARVRETYLMLIQQGWNYAPAPSAQQPPQPQAPPQPPSPAQATVSLRVAQNLTLRTAPDAHSEKVIVGPPLNDAIPADATVELHYTDLNTDCRRYDDVDAAAHTIWCRGGGRGGGGRGRGREGEGGEGGGGGRGGGKGKPRCTMVTIGAG